jgi:hypothetical protein
VIVRTLRLLVDVVVGGAAWVLLVPWCWSLLVAVWTPLAGPPPDEVALAAGLLTGLVLVLWRKPNLLLHTWLHETAHALMCNLLLVRVSAISVSDGQGGAVRHEAVDPVRLVAILIAPYVLPMVAGPLLLARWLCDDGPLRIGLTFLCGIGLASHLDGLWLNLRLNTFGPGADLQRVGHLLASALIAAALLLLASAALVVLFAQQPPAWWSGLFRR